MSDLLPLVIAALREKTLVDTKEELDSLYKRVETSTSIEVIHEATNISGDDDEEDIVVCASGKFEDGYFGNSPNLWEVPLHDNKRRPTTTYKLKDLEKCCVCVGGGFTIQSLLSDVSEGWLDSGKDGTIGINLCFGGYFTLWVCFIVDGWPKEEWEPLLQGELFPEPEEVIQYLVGTVARNHPEATARFETVSFVATTIQGPLRRVLTKKRKQQMEEEKKEIRKESVLREFIRIVIDQMAEQQRQDLWLDHLQENEVVGFFVHCGLHNFIQTDDEGTKSKVSLIVHHLRLYLKEGLDSLWQQETSLKERIENLISQQAERLHGN